MHGLDGVGPLEEAHPPRTAFKRYVLPALVPTGLFLAARQAANSASEIRTALAAARDASARRRANIDLKPVAVRLPDGQITYLSTDPTKRFEQLYESFGWDEEFRAGQIRACRRAKLACMAIGLLCVLACLAVLAAVSGGLAVAFIPLTLMVISLNSVLILRWALLQYQYTQRSLVRCSTFMSQPGFFRWIFS